MWKITKKKLERSKYIPFIKKKKGKQQVDKK